MMCAHHLYVKKYMVAPLIGMLSAMIWRVIYTVITNFVKNITGVDKSCFCTIFNMMVDADIILIDNGKAARCKHRALTGMLRYRWVRYIGRLKKTVYNCDVLPYLGALPPELRAQLPKNKIASVTAQFRENLENFLIANAFEIREMNADKVYDVSSVGDLFGTKCVLESKGINVYGFNPWSGSVGFVCKMSFPEINAHYALKLFYKDAPDWALYDHGPWFEIATAFAANKAEPKDNNPVYMASLISEQYMLSKWAGDKEDKLEAREQKNAVFETRLKENESRNLRGGRRIDWGETFLSAYGCLTYRGRKLVRQIMAYNENAVKKSLASINGNFDKREFDRAIDYINAEAVYTDNKALKQFLEQVNLR